MGQVHSMILEKGDELLVHHASVDFAQVVTERWSEISGRLQNVSSGYTIYALDPAWHPSTKNKSIMKGELECERQLLRSEQD